MTRQSSDPPEPPRLKPKLRLHASEWLGIPLLAVLPVLAMLNVFGPASETARTRNGNLEATVEYPSRVRFEMTEQIKVRVINTGAMPAHNVTVALDPSYVQAFSEVTFVPEPERPYVVRIAELLPGEERLIAVELRADDYGVHDGALSLTTGNTTEAAQLKTLVLP